MTIRIALDPLLAKRLFNIVGEVNNEFRLNISADGWNAVVVDNSDVILISIDLPKDNFLYYEFDAYGVISVGIDVDEIENFLGDENISGAVQFTVSKAEEKYAGRYQLEITQGMFACEMLLLNSADIRREPKLPLNVSLDYRMHISTNDIKLIIKKASRVSEYISFMFRLERDCIVFAAIANDNGKILTATKPIHKWQKLRDGARDSASSLYSLDYLSDILNVIPSEHLWINIGNDKPCKLEFILGATGQCEYLQAPRLEDIG